ncbi:hypothetical protein [Bifidobacterium scaligerum]|uniref:hypothetical protein n=1 Tax=Bifidobacterium scaligerum TaxID=2052656 RepID=UPI0010546D2B|nr:hypothetical protein [Bifidobacterium scaligerum]
MAIAVTFAYQTYLSKSLDELSKGNLNQSVETVEMTATATGKGTVTWNAGGGISSEDFQGTWSKTFTGEDAKKWMSLTVSGDVMGDDSQEVTCTIKVDGKEYQTHKGTGQSAFASCDTYSVENGQ